LTKVESGAKLSEDTGKAMADMVASIIGVTTIMGDINRATDRAGSRHRPSERSGDAARPGDPGERGFADRINAAALLLNYQANTLREAVGIFHIS
jgi:methyl-accepting chemotaxis protein